MFVYVIIPVCNRLGDTRAVLDALNKQTIRGSLRIIFVDDGSTDGTLKYLQKQKHIEVLSGDGSLWWTGATQLGLNHASLTWRSTDYVLLLNNDLTFDSNYIESLLKDALLNPNSAIGSALYDIDSRILLKVGPKIDLRKKIIKDMVNELDLIENQSLKPYYEVDALGGRGTLYSAIYFEKYGHLRPRLLPHYFADYEIAMRFKRGGYLYWFQLNREYTPSLSLGISLLI